MTPSWVSLLADDAMVSCPDLAEWIGVTAVQIGAYTTNGMIPCADLYQKRKGHRSPFWRVKTIRDWIKAGKPRVER